MKSNLLLRRAAVFITALLCYCATVLLLYCASGCATITEVKESSQLQEVPVITDIELQDYVITVKISKPFMYTIYRSSDPYKMVVELLDVNIGTFKNKIVSDKAGITEIVPYQIESPSLMAKLEMLLHTPSIVEPEYKDNALIIKIKEDLPKTLLEEIKEEIEEEESTEESKQEGEETVEEVEVKEKAKTAEIPQIIEGEYTGKKISLDFQDADIVPIFRLLADISGYNIVVSPEVKGRLTMKLINVPWDQALDIILKTFSLGKSVEGNIIRIAPTTVFAKESEDKAKAKEAEIKAEPIETRVFPVSYADVDKIETTLKNSKALSSRGSISTDKRTSSIIVKDVASSMPEIESLIKTLDTPTPQVMIEARIVEAETTSIKDLGIQWGFLWSPPDSRLTVGGIKTAEQTPGGTKALLGRGTFRDYPLIVNFPSAADTSGGGAIGLGYLNASQTFVLDLQLSALESARKGKIISSPKIMTIDNEKATIKQGKKIPVQTVSAEGTQTQFIDMSLELTVTPHMTPDGSISMKIDSKKNEALTETVGGIPVMGTSEATTQVIIKDGETIVIGGIFKTTESESESGVPGLSKIPILGWLFKKERTDITQSELLIFITPRIVEKK
ncbi:MAG: type IV pilus secretin PilQ [Nitrospirota bacterium]